MGFLSRSRAKRRRGPCAAAILANFPPRGKIDSGPVRRRPPRGLRSHLRRGIFFRSVCRVDASRSQGPGFRREAVLMRYFEMVPIVSARGCRPLGVPRDADGKVADDSQFRGDRPLTCAEVFIPMVGEGELADFLVAMVGFAVVSAKCRDIIREFVTEDRIAFVPARLTADGEVKIPDRYFAWAKLEHVECIDYERCKVQWYPEDFGFRPLAGQVEHVWGLKIRPEAVAGLHLFRVKGWPVSIIASEALLTAFHENDITGVLVTAEV